MTRYAPGLGGIHIQRDDTRSLLLQRLDGNVWLHRQPRRVTKPIRARVIVESLEQVSIQNKYGNWLLRTRPVSCSVRKKVGVLDRSDRYIKKGKNNKVRRGTKPVGCRAGTGVDVGGPLGAGATKK